LLGKNWSVRDSAVETQSNEETRTAGSQRAWNSSDKHQRQRQLQDSNSQLDWYPVNEDAFKFPENEKQLSEVAKLVRSSMDDKSLPGRLGALTDLCAMMTPENARAFLGVFTDMGIQGYDRPWERSIFFARYGEVMGAQSAMEFEGSADFTRIVTSAAIAKPEESIEWVNNLPDGSTRDLAVRKVIFGIGMQNPDFVLEAFDSLAHEDQINHAIQKDMITAVRRNGGVKEIDRLATQLLNRPEEHMQSYGRRALNETLKTLSKGSKEDLDTWLRNIPPAHLKLLDLDRLPEDYQVSGVGQ